MGKIIAILAIILFMLHQDIWFWDSDYLVFGFMPIGLAYHVAYSLAAACLWAIAIKIAWPTHIENFASDDDAVPGKQEALNE